MEISLLLMQQIAQLFLILIMGYAVVKVGLLKASDSRVLSVVMVYLVTPCVIINAFQIDDTPEIRKGLLYSMAIAAAIHVVLLVLSALLSRPLKLDAVEQVNVIYSNAAAGGVLHPPQLSAHSAASGGMPAGGSGAAVGLPCIQLGGRRQEHPDDGLPCRHHPCLCYCYLHGSAL